MMDDGWGEWSPTIRGRGSSPAFGRRIGPEVEGDIQVEVDGEIIFTGKANSFFEQHKRLPSRNRCPKFATISPGVVTAEEETKNQKVWAVSYVPIPFEKRFRYLQRDKVYANIDIKAFPQSHQVESFLTPIGIS